MNKPGYFDTSMIAPLYRPEALTEAAEELLHEYRPAISLLTEVELASTIARWVRTEEMSDEHAVLAEKTFADDLRLNVFERTAVEDRHYWQARTWLQKRTTNLRTLDALHLAVAFESGWPMITADKRLYQAAASLGCPSQLIHGNDGAD